MNQFQKEFIMQMFLDTDDITTVNRAVIAAANIINDSVDNMNAYKEAVNNYWEDVESDADYCSVGLSPQSRIKRYYEQAVLNFSDDVYEATFKAKRTTVKALITFLETTVSVGTIPLDKKVHIFMMFLMSDLSLEDVGRLFGLHKSTVSYIFHELGTVLTENRHNFISLPSIGEQNLTRMKVNNRFKFPNCVGFIDACRLKIGLKENKRDSVLLQAVCDESFMFINIHLGKVGRVKKMKVFNESELAQELQNYVEFENHILGDCEYKLKLNLITPFTSEEVLTDEEMKFNEVHWKTRYYIGRAFELLKEKFRKLNNINMVKNNSWSNLIYSACVLHNFIIMNEGCPEVKYEMMSCNDAITLNSDIVRTAVEKRQFLCNYINFIDSDGDPSNKR